MKTTITVIVALLISLLSFAQPQRINYKAVIKDSNGNLVVNQTLDVKFTILKNSDNSIVYEETHSNKTTDANGILIVNIGGGTPLGPTGPMVNVDWGNGIHTLKTEIDLEQDGSFENLGQTAFNAVPYALYAPNRSTGLELITENDGENDNSGWRLVGSNANYFGPIGLLALDLSNAFNNADDYGATGWSSIAMGNAVRASGVESIAIGSRGSASGDGSIAIGFNTKAKSYRSTALGSNNIGGGSFSENWDPQDPLFEIGNSKTSSSPSNALTILKNGTITAPSFDISEITEDKALVTKEYLDSQGVSGLEQITEGTFPNEKTGWRLKGFEPGNYGNIGDYAVDLSYSSSSENPYGATGFISFAAGNRTSATNSSSTALGSSTVASGISSTALGGNTAASGNYSTTMGQFTSASGDYSTAMGTINFDDPNALLMVGNGANLSNPNNVFTVYKNGMSVFDGQVTVTNLLEVNDLGVTGTILISSNSEVQNPSTGFANLIPIAYGSISANATPTVLGGTGNFTVTRNTTTNEYTISVAGKTLSAANTVTSVVANTTTFRTVNVTYSGGNIIVHIFASSFAKVISPFQFTVYQE